MLGSGGPTSATGVRPKGPMTSGSPDVSSSAEKSLGISRTQSGASRSTAPSTADPRTAAAICGCDVAVSGTASSQAATRTATACSPAPITLSTPRATGLWIPLRSARPSTMPAISPTTTTSTMSPMPARMRRRGSSTCTSTFGANRMPATAPMTTPRKAKADATAPCRHPDDAASTATSTTTMSSQVDPVTVTTAPILQRRGRSRDHARPRCPRGPSIRRCRECPSARRR